MNLENLNLVELNAQEVKEVVGGRGFWTEVAIALGVEAAIAVAKEVGQAVVNDWNSRSGATTTATERYNPWP